MDCTDVHYNANIQNRAVAFLAAMPFFFILVSSSMPMPTECRFSITTKWPSTVARCNAISLWFAAAPEIGKLSNEVKENHNPQQYHVSLLASKIDDHTAAQQFSTTNMWPILAAYNNAISIIVLTIHKHPCFLFSLSTKNPVKK